MEENTPAPQASALVVILGTRCSVASSSSGVHRRRDIVISAVEWSWFGGGGVVVAFLYVSACSKVGADVLVVADVDRSFL